MINTDAIAHEIVDPFYWADYPGAPKRKGIRIQRGQGFIFIPYAELLDLATALADIIESKNGNNA